MDMEKIELIKTKRREERQKQASAITSRRPIDASKKYNYDTYETRVRTVIKYTREGYTKKEIADFMNCDEEQIDMLIGLCSKWFTDEQLAKFASKRKELKTKACQKETTKQNTKQQSEEINVLYKSLKMLRLGAQREDEIQLSGEKDIGLQKRKNFAKGLTRIYNLGGTVEEEDIEILLDMIYTSPEIINSGNIRFLILNAFKTGGKESANKMIDELMVSLKGHELGYLLNDYDNWINRTQKMPKNSRENEQRQNIL